MREALAALEVARERGGATARWADLRHDAFAASARADRLHARAAAVHRARLASCDVESGADLERTAAAFAAAYGDIRAAAEALCQHPNTVRYRLRKIKAALDMADASDRELAQLLGLVFLA